MTCAEFQSRFSDYFDGLGEPSFVSEASAHLDGCEDCRRYRDVVERGVHVLRAVPTPTIGEDFLPRLQHRIYHLEDGPALTRWESAGSATTAATAIVIATLIAAAAWSPVLVRAPEVALEPIVVSEPEPRVIGLRTPTFQPLLARDVAPGVVVHRSLWEDPLLLTRHSPLAAGRAHGPVVRRADFE